ncbi:hypothetical protein NBRC116494_21010 [Aurantivibrio plasticivorans]
MDVTATLFDIYVYHPPESITDQRTNEIAPYKASALFALELVGFVTDIVVTDIDCRLYFRVPRVVQ